MLSFTKMRLVDRYGGGFLCSLFSVLSRLEGRREPRAEKPIQVQKILIMKYFGMGSLILATPMVRALRRRYPNVRIDLLTTEENRILTQILPVFDKVHTVNTRGLASVIATMAKALRHIQREKYDVVIDAEFFSRLSTLVSYFSRARYSVGFYLPEIWRGNFLTHPVHFNYYRHAIVVFMALAKSLGADSEDYEVEHLVVPDHVQADVRTKLRKMGIAPEQRLVCVNVNTGPLSPERRWTEENFVKLTRQILWEFPDVTVILIGGRSDASFVASFHGLFDTEEQSRVLNVAGKFDLLELCGLFKLSDLLITNDSGPLHLAEALRTKTVSFFGPETPLLYGPTGNNHLVFYKGIYCSPCLNVQNQKKAPCNGNNVCMKLISVEEVFTSVKKLLEGQAIVSPFHVSLDVPLNELLIDYRSPDPLPSSIENSVPITVARNSTTANS